MMSAKELQLTPEMIKNLKLMQKKGMIGVVTPSKSSSRLSRKQKNQSPKSDNIRISMKSETLDEPSYMEEDLIKETSLEDDHDDSLFEGYGTVLVF